MVTLQLMTVVFRVINPASIALETRRRYVCGKSVKVKKLGTPEQLT